MTDVAHGLGLVAVAAPAAALAALGAAALAGRPWTEAATGRLIRWAVATGLACTAGVAAVTWAAGESRHVLDLGSWVVVHPPGAGSDHPGYHFQIKLVFDRLSVPFLLLSLVLCGTVGAFATRYLHREPGYHRFFVLYASFVLGMVLTAAAGTIETLFVGRELVGMSSVFLVGFFQEQPAPVRNALRVWVVYRVSDAALLLTAVLMHRMAGTGDFDALLGGEPWPGGRATVGETEALVLGLLLLTAAAGKSALVTFSGWLPRAMEGPTPSSAVFYGALSVHLGAYLLLRTAPLIDASPPLAAAVVALGVATALFGFFVGSAQTDIKSALSFASLGQVGVIVAEIGLGWHYVPLAHLVGHACLRTLQFIRAPTLLQDYRHLENAVGGRLARRPPPWVRLAPPGMRVALYQWAAERGHLDDALAAVVVRPFVRLFAWLDRWERRAADALAGRPGGEPALPGGWHDPAPSADGFTPQSALSHIPPDPPA
jgi:NADH-quinone oxidoreductase subunit L